MFLLISLIILIIIGSVLMYIDNNYIGSDGLFYSGLIFIVINASLLLVCIMFLILKPIVCENFMVEYNTFKSVYTSQNDIRDTNYTQRLIEINTTINKEKRFINNKWIGIFYSKKIAELEPLNKEE